MIRRAKLLAGVRAAIKRGRVVALVGPRQSGKTTLARLIVPGDSARYFDLEDPASLARLEEPMTALAGLKGTVVIDEVQRRPDLFPVLRVLADRNPLPARFLVLGSASPALRASPPSRSPDGSRSSRSRASASRSSARPRSSAIGSRADFLWPSPPARKPTASSGASSS